jgi:adenylosuccinate synthase
LKICTGYEYEGEILNDFPASLNALDACKPLYETWPGWSEDISGVKKLKDLPENVINYLNRIEELTETPIHIVSVGAERTQTIVRMNPFL